MAVLRNTLLAALALAYTTSAVPFAIEKRGHGPPRVVTETVWTTVDVTTTIWIEATPKAEAPAAAAAAVTTSSKAAVQPIPSSAPPAPPAPPAEPTPAAFAQQAAQAPPAAAASSVSPLAPPPAAASPSPIASPSTSAPTIEAKTAGAVSGGPCEGSGNVCSGDVTHYDGGLGACGWNVNTASDMQIALPYELMGIQSNGNPYCGRSLSIKASDGSVVKTTVGDKCMGCVGKSIDLTDALFKAVVPNGDGRVSGVQWWFD